MKNRWLVALCLACISLMSGMLPGYAQSRNPKLATSVARDTNVWQALMFWQEELARASREQFVVQMFPESQLGDEASVLSGVRFGHIEMALLSVDRLLTLSPMLSALATPALFRDAQHRSHVLNGPIGKELLANLSRYRMLGLEFFDADPQGIFSFQDALTTPAAFQNVAVGVPAENCDENREEQPEMLLAQKLEGLTVLDAQSVLICPEQQAQAITSGDIAAWKSPVSNWSHLSSRLPKDASGVVFRYFDHPFVLLVNSLWFESLDPEEQALLIHTIRMAAQYQRQIADERMQVQLAGMQEAGIPIEVVEADLFNHAALPVFKALSAELGADFDALLHAIGQVK